MEEMVRSSIYFEKNILSKITDNNKDNKKYLEEITKSKIINSHRDNKIKSEEIWIKLPKSFKNIFQKTYYKYNIDKISKYFDYNCKIIE